MMDINPVDVNQRSLYIKVSVPSRHQIPSSCQRKPHPSPSLSSTSSSAAAVKTATSYWCAGSPRTKTLLPRKRGSRSRVYLGQLLGLCSWKRRSWLMLFLVDVAEAKEKEITKRTGRAKATQREAKAEEEAEARPMFPTQRPLQSPPSRPIRRFPHRLPQHVVSAHFATPPPRLHR